MNDAARAGGIESLRAKNRNRRPSLSFNANTEIAHQKEQDMTDAKTAIRHHLYDKLAETAESIRQGGAMDDEQLATAFLSIGLTVANSAFGPVQAAEWLRDMADQIERDELG
jgi:hypothetical protein